MGTKLNQSTEFALVAKISTPIVERVVYNGAGGWDHVMKDGQLIRLKYAGRNPWGWRYICFGIGSVPFEVFFSKDDYIMIPTDF